MPTQVINVVNMTPELSTLLRGDFVYEKFSFELYDNLGNSKGFLDCVLEGGTVKNNYLADIKGTCSLSIAEVGNFEMINFNTDRIKPYYEILDINTGDWLAFPLGMYVLSSAERVANKKVITREVDGYDLTQILKRRKALSRFVVQVGANPIEVIRTILTNAGLAHDIDDLSDYVSDSVKASRSYDPGTELIAIVNDLLAMVGYRSLYFDRNGIATSKLYIQPAERIVDFTYETDSRSLIAEGATLSQDIFEVPNVVQVIVSQPDRPVIVGLAKNENPNSPSSIPNTSEERVMVVSDQEDVTTQAQAVARARRILAQQSEIYETINFVTSIVPVHSENNVLQINHTDFNVDNAYSEIEWSINLIRGGTMTHSARRAVLV